MYFKHKTGKYGGQINLENEDNILLGYVRYINKLDHYWAPKIYISFIETTSEYRRIGIGQALLEQLKAIFPNEIITLEIMDGGETSVEYLQNFYDKAGFQEITSTSMGYIYAYIPEGKSLDNLQDVPEAVLYKELTVNYDNNIREYDFSEFVIEDLHYFYTEEGEYDLIGPETFKEFYQVIKGSEAMDLLKYT